MPECEERSEERLTTAGGSAFVSIPLAADYEAARELVESVNHHVRTPLTVILGHAGLLSHGAHDLPVETHQSLLAMQRAAHNLNQVVAGICDLVDTACLDPGAVSTVDVADLVTAEVATWQDRAAARAVRFLTDVDAGVTCVADPGRLRRALHELLDNAVTYAPARSIVGVTVSLAGGWIRLTVSDQGAGIDPADRERLTKPFERGTHPCQPLAGRGLGLALAAAGAASHHGRLVLLESPGGGLQACLEVPSDFTRDVGTGGPAG